MTARNSLLILLGLWATLALSLKARSDSEIPLETVTSNIKKVELEWYRTAKPMLFVRPPDVPMQELTARGQPGDLLLRVVTVADQTRITRQTIGQNPTSSTRDTPGLLYRLASLDLRTEEKIPTACPFTIEHTLDGSAVLRLKVTRADGAVTTQTATAQFGNCDCLRSGTEAVTRVSEELRRAGLQV